MSRPVEPVRILLVHQDESAFVCLWHLTDLLDDFCPGCRPEWHACRYADLLEPKLALAATDQARRADVVVFCLARSTELPPAVKQWTAGWIAAKRGQAAAIGWVIPCAYARPGRSEMEAYLDQLAREGGMTFLGGRQSALEWEDRPTGIRPKRTGSLSEPRHNDCEPVPYRPDPTRLLPGS